MIFKYFSLCSFSFEGSLVLIGGDPGVGKSTLLLQVLIFVRFHLISLLAKV